MQRARLHGPRPLYNDGSHAASHQVAGEVKRWGRWQDRMARVD